MTLAPFGTANSRYTCVTVTIPANTTDYDMSEHGLFDILKQCSGAIIRTDHTIGVKFNSTASDSIPVTSSESPFERSVSLSDMFITTGASSTIVTVEVYVL